MPNDGQKDGGIGVEYLVDLLSSVKSALSNIDNHNTQMYNILSELSENVNILTEFYKRQNQDQRTNQTKLDTLAKAVADVSAKLDLSNQEIISSHDKLSSNLEIISGFKKETLEEINSNIKAVEEDLKYLKTKRQEQEIVDSLAAKREVEDKKAKQDKDKRQDDEDNPKNWFQKIVGFIKNLNESVSMLYKILVLIFGIILIALWFTGVITWEDIKNISGLKFF